jgi:hypothetical protein
MLLTDSPKRLHYITLLFWRKSLESDPSPTVVEDIGRFLGEPYNSPQDVGKLIVHLDTRIAMMRDAGMREYHEPLSQKVSEKIISGEYAIDEALWDEWDVQIVNNIVWVLKGSKEQINWTDKDP